MRFIGMLIVAGVIGFSNGAEGQNQVLDGGLWSACKDPLGCGCIFSGFPEGTQGGVGNHVDVPFTTAHNPADGEPFTVDLWVNKFSEGSYSGDGGRSDLMSPLSNADNSNRWRSGFMFYARSRGNKWEFYWGTGRTGRTNKWGKIVADGVPYVEDEWTRLTASYDPDSRTMTFHVGGSVFTKESVEFRPNTADAVLRLGAGSTFDNEPKYRWVGGVKDVRILTGVFTPGEIDDGIDKDLVLWSSCSL